MISGDTPIFEIDLPEGKKYLEITKKFLAKLTTNLDKDQMTTAHDMGIITLNEIGFSKMLATGNVEEFAQSIKERVAKAKTVGAFYNREIKFFTANEEKSIKNTAKNTNPKLLFDEILCFLFKFI